MSETKKEFKINQDAIKNIEDFMAKGYFVKVGILAGANHEGEIGAVELAAIHEFGSQKRKIPERSFLRQTMANRKEDFSSFIESNKKKIMDEIAAGNGSVIMEKIGVQWVRYVMETFDSQGPNWAPLADSTIRNRKNYSIAQKKNPKLSGDALMKKARQGTKILQDTGEMKKSITFEVVG